MAIYTEPVVTQFKSDEEDLLRGMNVGRDALGRFTERADETATAAAGMSSSFSALATELSSRFVITAGDVVNFAERMGRGLFNMAVEASKTADIMSALTVDISGASEALHGTVRQVDLAKAANRAMEAGLDLTGEQFRAVAVAAAGYAQRTGIDTVQAIDTLTGALLTGASRGLKPFGLAIDDVAKGLDATEEMAAKQAAAVEALTAKYGDATVELQGLDDSIDQLSVAFHEFLLLVGAGAEGPLGSAVSDLNDLFAGLVLTMQGLPRAGSALSGIFEDLAITLEDVGLLEAGTAENAARMADAHAQVAREARGALDAERRLATQRAAQLVARARERGLIEDATLSTVEDAPRT